MEFKALPILLSKDVGDDRLVKSLFAVTGHVDGGADRIWPGAFAKTLQERADRVRVLWQHNPMDPPVGVPTKLFEVGRDELPGEVLQRWPDATGALVGHIKYLDTPRGNEILTGIREGAIAENSIGYDAIKFDFEDDSGVRVRNLREVRLWDVSPVNWGMQEAARNMKRSAPLTDADIYDAIDWLVSQAKTDETLSRALVSLRQTRGALKAGRVLSSANLERLKNALGVLQEILLAAEPPDDEKRRALTVIQKLAIAEREFNLLTTTQ